ncbi:MAG: hypothetical protein A3C61_01200 [Candidatus Yanofskybacteria bacterium RIFCSPHIGHO2_02_FULL_39_10]|uniref:Saccharopine dehydrogenase n=1 Tax=Candidatus Yanofskybacteria bacterium RIFCSPHIGHO2_02_FULL_39_10 TaxID=1802674 RepID=A0A1F8FCX2_9BACT|nr:MAG: hypothetical protein A3C61_01200 [Candidatus Yanofskybacteria bacterium RIFCSPHIGHO2_02_FULL_39_10]
MRYLILGAGVGKAIAYFLSRQKSTDWLVLADMDIDKAKKACAMINGPESCIFCIPIRFDAEKLSSFCFSKYDVVISALPAKCNYALANKVIDAGVNFCDLGGVISVTEKMIAELNDKAEKNCVSVIPDCGIMPGLGIMLARIFVEEFDKAEDICIYVGGIPQKPKPPLFYQKVFNIDGVESICYDPAPVLRNGQVVLDKPFSRLENFKIRELAGFSPDSRGSVEAFITAGASIAHDTFRGLGVNNFCEKTIRWPGFAKFISGILRQEFTEKMTHMLNIPVDHDNPDLLWMEVVVSGTKNHMRTTRFSTLLDLYDESTGLTAMERCTGFPTALIAKYLAKHEARIGVRTPEKAFSVDQLKQMREELKEYLNIKIKSPVN